jgi:hypothetical protein
MLVAGSGTVECEPSASALGDSGLAVKSGHWPTRWKVRVSDACRFATVVPGLSMTARWIHR